MQDDDDLERIAGKTRTESAELRRQVVERRSRKWYGPILAVCLDPRFLAVSFAVAIGFVIFRILR